MSAAQMHRMSYDEGFKDGVNTGIQEERERFMAVLVKMGVIRESLFDLKSWVIYTEAGAKDVTPATLLGEDWQRPLNVDWSTN